MACSYSMDKRQAYLLYLCHTLSAWQARSYEFAAVMFTAAAYPGGLRAVSLLGITTSLSIVIFGPSIGRWIDNASTRLKALLATIAINRLAIITGCIFWFLIVEEQGRNTELGSRSLLQGQAKSSAFALLMILGIIETLARRANVISMERDWVPFLVPCQAEKNNGVQQMYSLTEVNATMARIGMSCELSAPIVMTWFLSIVGSTRLAVVVVAILNLASLWVEIGSARRLASDFIGLCGTKDVPTAEVNVEASFLPLHQQRSTMQRTFPWFECGMESIKVFFDNDVWRASLAMCLLHTLMLNISSTTVVFLLDSGFSLNLITIVEAFGTFFELASTFVTPYAVSNVQIGGNPLAAISVQEDESTVLLNSNVENPVADASISESSYAISQVGLWGITEMFLVLAPAIPMLITLTHKLHCPIPRSSNNPSFSTYPILSIILFSSLAISRLGRGTFALCTTQLAQVRVPNFHRASFAGAEIMFVSLFGLVHHFAMVVWSSTRDFGWVASGSFVAVALALAIYWRWITLDRRERGVAR